MVLGIIKVVPEGTKTAFDGIKMNQNGIWGDRDGPGGGEWHPRVIKLVHKPSQMVPHGIKMVPKGIEMLPEGSKCNPKEIKMEPEGI